MSESVTVPAVSPPRLLIQLLSLFFLSTFTFRPLSSAIRVINNGLAPPEIVHSPLNVKRQCVESGFDPNQLIPFPPHTARCLIRAPPLDLVFILDSSGSLKNKFQDEVDVIRRIVRYVTIGETATRVMLIQFRYGTTTVLANKLLSSTVGSNTWNSTSTNSTTVTIC